MKANIYDIEGKKIGDIEMPKLFDQEIRPDLIKRAFLHEMSHLYQPKGIDPKSGMKTSAEYLGRKESYRSMKNRGQSMLPREKLPEGRQGNVRTVPNSVGGRRAHPPVVEKRLIERMNKKEYLKALLNSLAATTHSDLVLKRGHKFDGNVPLVLATGFDNLEKTKDVNSAISKIVSLDLQRSKNGTTKTNSRVIRSRTYVPRSLLIVTDAGSKLLTSAKNISGVDVVSVDDVKVSLLAPGGNPGRLTAYTENAVKKLTDMVKVVG